MDQLQIELKYRWYPVYLREKVEYLFPMAISPHMRLLYKGPAVFKWEVFQKITGDKKIVYIGEAQELCPKRLYGYLAPGPTQVANQKVNSEFRAYLKEKLSIRLDICEVAEFKLAGVETTQNPLNDKHNRRLLVEAMILDHQKKSYTVVDL